MADSDEEHDRSRSRDKFRRERNDYGDKPRNRADRRTWRDDHETGSRRRTREDFDDERDRRRHSSPGRGRDWSPPHKRMRREPWEGFRGFPPDMMAPFGMRGPWMPPDMPGGMHHIPPRPGGHPSEPIAGPGLKRKTMLSFKQFLAQQDDSIDESHAIQLYQDYKSDFKRKQITEFFDEHKEEDWLISKYHPMHISAGEEALKASLQSRVQAFLYLFESGRLDGVPVWTECVDDIINTMDSGVIVMEGGTTHDLLSLVKKAPDASSKDDETEEQVGEKEKEDDGVKEICDGATNGDLTSGDTVEKDKTLFMEVSDEQRQLAQQARVYGEQMQALSDISEGKKKRNKKRKQEQGDGDEYSYTGDKSDGSSEESEAEVNPDEPPPPGLEPAEPETELQSDENSSELQSKQLPETQSTETVTPRNGNKNSDPPRPLHTTRSVYIRHLPPRIAAEDIVEICRTIPGYLRIAFADPDPNRGYERRGWVTYSYNTDIREVTARLTTNKVKDIQLNCMVNRELTRRVKFGHEVAWASRAVHSDLLITLSLVKAMDKKKGLWEHAISDTKVNPVLAVSDSLLSEEALSGNTVGEEEEGVVSDPGTEILSEADSKVKALDRLIWYLRLVHSVDFYNGMAFPSEDCMPHRCGIFTVRPAKPTAATQDEVSSYTDSTKSRIKPLLETKGEMSEDDMEKFGKKDPDAEVERFIEVNTQRLAENKYLCPLSGKKFKGPDFVHKHIFNKHGDKVDAVRQETEFFNNYLRDLDRPGQQDTALGAPSSASGSPASIVHLDERQAISPGGQSTPGGWGQPPQMMFGRGGFGPGMGGFPPGMMGGRGGFRSRGGRRGRGRRVINYHDLDAPEEMY